MTNFSELYQAYSSDVRRFALFLSGNPAVADNLVSETFIRLWHARERLDLATVKAYLLAIARNLFLEDRRRRSRRAELDERQPDRRPGPEAIAAGRIELQVVLAALQALPEADRAAVLLRADGKLSYEDIGAVLGITPAAARVKVHRARVKLNRARGAQTARPGAGGYER